MLFILTTSCMSIPPGKAPEGPVIADSGGEKPKTFSDPDSAIDLMVTSISTRCVPVASAGKELPTVTNEFKASLDTDMNNIPLELWKSLIKMKLIRPVLPDEGDAVYRLTSEITKSEKSEGLYEWRLRLLENDSDTEIWKDEVIFHTGSRSPKESGTEK